MIQLRRNEETLSRELTPAEKAALHLVAADQEAMDSVGTNKWCDSTATTASQAIRTDIVVSAIDDATVYVLVIGTLGAKEAELVDLELHIPEETLKQVGPTASVRKLLNMRRDLLSNLPRRKAELSGSTTSVSELLNKRR